PRPPAGSGRGGRVGRVSAPATSRRAPPRSLPSVVLHWVTGADSARHGVPVLPLFRTSELLLASPSVPDFHRIGACRQAFADCHRRFGFTPTPEHVDASECTQRAGSRFIPRNTRHFSSRESRRSARTLPPVWHVGQYSRLLSAKNTDRTVSPQTGQASPRRACTCIPRRLASFRSAGGLPADSAI